MAVNFILNNNPTYALLKKEKLKKTIPFCFITKSNGTFYNQVDGVAIDSFLIPAHPIIFIGYKELNEYNLNKLKFYLRYIDAILVAFDNEQG